MLQPLGQGQAAGIQLMASGHFVTWAANIRENFSTNSSLRTMAQILPRKRYTLCYRTACHLAMWNQTNYGAHFPTAPYIRHWGARRCSQVRFVCQRLSIGCYRHPCWTRPSQKLTTLRFLRSSDNRCDGHCILTYIHSQAVMRVAWFSNCTSEHP